jgi:MAF protein
MPRLILASTSPYRARLLKRLRIPFDVVAPEFREIQPGTMPVSELVRRNTLGKAHSVLHRRPRCTIIASDQLAVCGEKILGKPGTEARARKQLLQLSGKSVDFITGLAVLNEKEEHYDEIPFRVHFRRLSRIEIETYVRLERPLDCAGSFKSEGLGICLFERLEGEDPTALMGLPLIRLSHYLAPLRHLALK